MLETVILWSIGFWFIFHLLTRADISECVRKAIVPRLPVSAMYAFFCPLCFSWWTLLAMAAFAGAPYYLPFLCPPVVLLMDQAYCFFDSNTPDS